MRSSYIWIWIFNYEDREGDVDCGSILKVDDLIVLFVRVFGFFIC